METLNEISNGVKYTYKLAPGNFLIIVGEDGRSTAMRLNGTECKALISALDAIRRAVRHDEPAAPAKAAKPSTPAKSAPKQRKYVAGGKKTPSMLSSSEWRTLSKAKADDPKLSWAKLAEIVGVNGESLRGYIKTMAKRGYKTLEDIAVSVGEH